MNGLIWQQGAARYQFDTHAPHCLAIEIDLAAPTLTVFGADLPTATALRVGGFIGEVGRGGSCNCQTVTFTPHCHGTHTESVGHLTTTPLTVAALAQGLYLAEVISVTTAHAAITRAQLAAALPNLEAVTAVVVRTRSHPPDQSWPPYDSQPRPAWFAADGLAWLAAQGIEHLLVDVPSVDRMDDPQLPAHRAFWGLPAGSVALDEAQRAHATITELICVPDTVSDGRYVLNLQVAPLRSDAAPSRPVLYPCQRELSAG